MIYNGISQLAGRTPHVRVKFPELPNANVYIKLEGHNPTGSIKDRTCICLLQDALDRGQLKAGVTVLDASSGNMGCAIAFYTKLYGYKSHVISSSKLTAVKRDFILYYGATLDLIGDWTIEGNRYCTKLIQEQPGQFCFLDQLHNWNNPKAHYESTGPEILSEFPELAMVAGSLGSGGSLLGISEYIKERAPNVRVMAVQAATGTRLPGTATLDDGDYVTPFIEKGFKENIFDLTFKVSESDAVARTFQLRDQGIFCGLQTGGVAHAAIQAALKHNIAGNIVLVSGDSGWKNMDRLLAIPALVPAKESMAFH